MKWASVRFTIRRMTAAVALVAFVLWLQQHPDGVPFAVGLGALALAFACAAAQGEFIHGVQTVIQMDV